LERTNKAVFSLSTTATMTLSRLVAARALRTMAQVRPAQIPVRLRIQIAVANSTKFTVKRLPTPCIKLAAADLVPFNPCFSGLLTKLKTRLRN
jgi:hypothetical protein